MTRVTATMLDGTKLEADGNYMALADLFDFEDHFGYPFGRDAKAIEAGEPVFSKPGAYIPWAILRRAGLGPADFDEFCRNLAGLEVDLSDRADLSGNGEEPDPTTVSNPLPTPSPS